MLIVDALLEIRVVFGLFIFLLNDGPLVLQLVQLCLSLVCLEQVYDRVALLVQWHIPALVKLLYRTVDSRQVREKLVCYLVVLVYFPPQVASGCFELHKLSLIVNPEDRCGCHYFREVFDPVHIWNQLDLNGFHREFAL